MMLFVIFVGHFGIQAKMAELKAIGLSAETLVKFGRLHGIASVLFLFNSLAGLALVISGTFPIGRYWGGERARRV